MKFYNSIGPNPRVVRMFMAEKGIEMPMQEVDLRGGENRQAPYNTEVNPSGQCPALQLDDGQVITEVTAICDYLDETHPDKPLFGRTPEEKAETRMWVRRIDLNIVEPMLGGYRYGDALKFFEPRLHCIPAASDDLKQIAQEKLAWLDGLMDGNQFICGDRFNFADVFAFCFLDFGMNIGQAPGPDCKWIPGWHERMKARPSTEA